MNPILSANRRPDLNACACTSRVFLWIARALLILTSISLVTMPVTQHLWNWDRFLHGGRDFELSTLMILSVLALVLVLSRNLKQSIDSWLSEFSFLALARHSRKQIVPSSAPLSMFLTHHVPVSDTGMENIPLRI